MRLKRGIFVLISLFLMGCQGSSIKEQEANNLSKNYKAMNLESSGFVISKTEVIKETRDNKIIIDSKLQETLTGDYKSNYLHIETHNLKNDLHVEEFRYIEDEHIFDVVDNEHLKLNGVSKRYSIHDINDEVKGNIFREMEQYMYLSSENLLINIENGVLEMCSDFTYENRDAKYFNIKSSNELKCSISYSGNKSNGKLNYSFVNGYLSSLDVTCKYTIDNNTYEISHVWNIRYQEIDYKKPNLNDYVLVDDACAFTIS